MRERSCALVVVGNEILSGKVQDSNAYFAARELRKIGVALARIATIPDELDLIAGEVAYCSRNFDFVITSGGVGPTHDDLTMEGVARAFKRRLVMNPVLEALVREHFRERSLDAGLRMAQVPEGAVLNDAGDIRFPTVQIENVYVLPGIPQLFEAKLRGAQQPLRNRPVFHARDLSQRERRRDRRAPERMHAQFSRVDAGFVSADRRSRLPREVNARVEKRGVSRARVSSSDAAAAGRCGGQN